MGAKYRSPIYNVNAILKGVTINKYGKTFAFEENADGFSYVDNETQPLPQDLKTFLAGDNTITKYAFPSNVDKLSGYILYGYPNVDEVYLFKTVGIAELDEHTFDGLNNLESIYVPSDLLLSYQSTYANYDYVDKFKALVLDYVLTIPYIDNVVLTKSYVDDFIGLLNQEQKGAATKVIIGAGFTSIEDEALTGLNVLENCDSLDLGNVLSAGVDILKGISNIKYVYINEEDFVLDGVIDSTETIQMKWLVPYNMLYTFIFKEYIKDYYITGYVSKMTGQTMPSRLESGYFKWFSSIDTTEASYLGDSETYKNATYDGKYYCFLIIDTLVISGSGTLTAQIIQDAIDNIDVDISPLEYIKKLVIDDRYTGLVSGLLDNAINNYLVNVDTIKCGNNPSPNFYTDMLKPDNQIKTLIAISISETYAFYRIELGTNSVFLRIATGGQAFRDMMNGRLYMYDKTTTTMSARYITVRSGKPKLFLAQDDMDYSNTYPFSGRTYVQSKFLKSYIENRGTSFTNLIGVLDGGNVYQNIGININMDYTKLSDTLTLDTTNGHLMENGVDLFAGYSATWYSDEDCTEVIDDLTTITSTTTAYVKLTAI